MPGWRDLGIALALAAIAAAAGWDLLLDLRADAARAHLVEEAMVVVLALGLLPGIAFELRRRALALAALRAELAAAQAAAASSAPEDRAARRELAAFVARQFAAWGLTESEREVGWLLLKGLSLKEIAGLRATAEKTVRQQASAIYRKAGVAGRHAFAAWFLEDVL